MSYFTTTPPKNIATCPDPRVSPLSECLIKLNEFTCFCTINTRAFFGSHLQEKLLLIILFFCSDFKQMWRKMQSSSVLQLTSIRHAKH